ncbi:MAG: phosphatase PAP2 family protein [Acidimicrobiia bacterium]
MPLGPASKRIRGGWALEVLGVYAVFSVYDWGRDQVQGAGATAFGNARSIVRWERLLGLYQEHRIQRWFLEADWFIAFWNVYYGTIHFVAPVAALIWLYRKAPVRYVRWRNTLLLMLAIGLLGFWLYPLMPPRLMPSRYGFVDTTARFFNFGPQEQIVLGPSGDPLGTGAVSFGNLFAAMPSLHVGWSTWSVLAVLPTVRRVWVRVLLCCYPVFTLFAITVTGNHWLLDAVGGWLALAAACTIAVLWERPWRRPVLAASLLEAAGAAPGPGNGSQTDQR